eukprot:TRINITY_DN3019_c1_g1_i1.p1 TRINITY_DN3019_c1_g1~~TRINITY_DN3019_c1_g1_i1.p1  ORF type:complete len:315 (+),score=37.97 TRINITY_DN3019_c1_g1_i1:527-1471(+)
MYAILPILYTLALSTDRPIIAVWAHPLTESDQPPDTGEYIAASYVKWLEAAGARVVPVRYNVSEDELKGIMGSVNGLVYPGGAVGPSESARMALKLAMNANDNGDYFPVWGTCLGFEWLAMMVAEDATVIQSGFNSSNVSFALDLTTDASGARMFGGSSPEGLLIQQMLSNKSDPVTFNAHELGLSPDTFSKNEKLTSFFDVLSTNKDLNGRVFISTMEAKNYPIYATQWHPERNAFEWAVQNFNASLPLEPAINHGPAAIKTTSFLAEFLVSEARKSKHAFKTPQEEYKSLIWHKTLVSYEYFVFSQMYITSP